MPLPRRGRDEENVLLDEPGHEPVRHLVVEGAHVGYVLVLEE